MSNESISPVVLEARTPKERTYLYPWIGVVLGVAVGFLVGHPLAMLVYELHQCMISGTTCNVTSALLHSFHWHMWPMMLLFSVFGGLSWGIIGFIFQRLRESRLRLATWHREFEFRVATLRHHYKNLALGIHGFSDRIERKLAHLDETVRQGVTQGKLPTYEELHPEFESLGRNFTVVKDSAQRLQHIMGEELLFLKALTSDSLNPVPKDFYPFLVQCVRELRVLRFRDKEIRLELNGRPLQECPESLVFPFEPHIMEVILQNIIGNAMKYGDHVQLRVVEDGAKVRVEVEDNGPGLDAAKLKSDLLLPEDQRKAENIHMGLEVTLHLLSKCGGRLSAFSSPGSGATFILEFPW